MRFRKITEHIKAQNWTAITLEFVIVVAGVLMALWLSEWSAARSQRAADTLVQEALREEMIDNLIGMEYYRSMGECHREQLTHIRDLLVESDGDWPGIQRRAMYTEAEDGRLVPNIYLLRLGVLNDDAWRAANESGALGRMDIEDRMIFEQLYSMFARYQQQLDIAIAARAEIGGLVFPGQLSSTDRLDALNQLILLDGSREYIARERDLPHVELTEEELGEIEQALGRNRTSLEEFGTLRPCFTGTPMPAPLLPEG